MKTSFGYYGGDTEQINASSLHFEGGYVLYTGFPKGMFHQTPELCGFLIASPRVCRSVGSSGWHDFDQPYLRGEALRNVVIIPVTDKDNIPNLCEDPEWFFTQPVVIMQIRRDTPDQYLWHFDFHDWLSMGIHYKGILEYDIAYFKRMARLANAWAEYNHRWGEYYFHWQMRWQSKQFNDRDACEEQTS